MSLMLEEFIADYPAVTFNIYTETSDDIVERQIGAAVCIEGAPGYGSATKFIPFAPTVQTNCVLAWRRERETSPVVREFIRYFRTAFVK